MKFRFIASAVVAALACTQATAEDWSGWYAGADTGYLARSTTGDVGTANSEGFFAGVSVGHWWQNESIVWGWDGGLTFGGARSRVDFFSDVPLGFSSIYADTITPSLRLKIGVPVGSLLPYLAAGPQYVHSVLTFRQSGKPDSKSHHLLLGATLSAGLEAKLTDNVSVTGEYGWNLTFPDGSNSNNGSGGRLGINYHFD